MRLPRRCSHACTVDELLLNADACSASDLRQLDARLTERLGVRLDDLQKKRLACIEGIRQKRKISKKAEYPLVRERVEQFWDGPARREEHVELPSMLAALEERLAHRSNDSGPGA
jgi:hypothetical protein